MLEWAYPPLSFGKFFKFQFLLTLMLILFIIS